jgi:AcrR family transcriptional regulator
MARQAKRSYDPAAMRGRLLDVAAAAFQARGYHATSTHDIMRDAGVTGGALHHHFPSKKSLALAVIRERVAAAVEETWIAPVREGRTAFEGILAALDQITGTLDARGKVLGCPLNNLAIELSLADPDFQTAVAEVFASWQKAIADKARADRPSAAAPMTPDELGTFVVASYSGAMAMAKAEQSSRPLRICAQQLSGLLGGRRATRIGKDADTSRRPGHRP